MKKTSNVAYQSQKNMSPESLDLFWTFDKKPYSYYVLLCARLISLRRVRVVDLASANDLTRPREVGDRSSLLRAPPRVLNALDEQISWESSSQRRSILEGVHQGPIPHHGDLSEF